MKRRENVTPDYTTRSSIRGKHSYNVIKAMTTPVTDGKMLVNATYHSAVVSSLAIGYARMAKMITKATPPKLDFNGYDIRMMFLHKGLAMASNDMQIKQGLIPEDIMK